VPRPGKRKGAVELAKMENKSLFLICRKEKEETGRGIVPFY